MKFWVSNEWAKCGIDNWLILGNKTGFGWTNKLSHCFGHFTAVILGHYCFNIPVWLCLLCSELWGIIYETVWDFGICKSGASKLDLVANNIGMLLAVLIILTSQLIHRLQISRSLILIIVVMGFGLVFTYKIIKLRRR